MEMRGQPIAVGASKAAMYIMGSFDRRLRDPARLLVRFWGYLLWIFVFYLLVFTKQCFSRKCLAGNDLASCIFWIPFCVGNLTRKMGSILWYYTVSHYPHSYQPWIYHLAGVYFPCLSASFGFFLHHPDFCQCRIFLLKKLGRHIRFYPCRNRAICQWNLLNRSAS